MGVRCGERKNRRTRLGFILCERAAGVEVSLGFSEPELGKKKRSKETGLDRRRFLTDFGGGFLT